MATGPFIGILVLNQNGREWLGPLYESIAKNGYAGVITYLVDNGSSDDSVALTQTRYPDVRIIRFSENLGYCMAYNRAMPLAFADGCDWVVWANNDVLLEPGALDELAQVAKSDQRIGICGPAFLAWDRDEPNYYMAGNHHHLIADMLSRSRAAADVDWVEGSFLMVSRECVAAVGPLDPLLFFYWEETDYCRRARYGGWRVTLALKALARHYAGGWSAANQANRRTANQLRSRNHYIYYLADPTHTFLRNIFKGLHLLVVNLRAAAKLDRGAVLIELSSFRKVVLEMPAVFRKWKRDRSGGRPAEVSEAYAHVTTTRMPSTKVASAALNGGSV